MKVLNSDDTGKIVIEFTSQDVKNIRHLFSIINADNGSPVPWWGTEDGTGAPLMDEEKYEQFYNQWTALFDTAEAKAYIDSLANKK